MNELTIIGNVINVTLVLIIGFFVRRWMNTVDANRKDDKEQTERDRISDREEVRRAAEAVADKAARTAENVAEKTAIISNEIKQRIEDNRLFYAQSCTDIKSSIDKLAEHVGIQNGRVGKLETGLAEQIAVCKTRNARTKRK
jgi:Na+/phosphate symporter